MKTTTLQLVQLPRLDYWVERARQLLEVAVPTTYKTTDDLPGEVNVMTARDSAAMHLENEIYVAVAQCIFAHYADKAGIEYVEGEYSLLHLAREIVRRVALEGTE